ncbi:MAG: hypothetical protein ACO4CS_15815 [bacterium]
MKWQNMLFVTRHEPSADQCAIAGDKGFNLIHVGDVNAFDPKLESILKGMMQEHNAEVVCCVHPMVAVVALDAGAKGIAIFENAMRAKEGEKPTFVPSALHVYVRDPDGDGFDLDWNANYM